MASNGRIAAVLVLTVAMLSASAIAVDVCGFSTNDLMKCLPAVKQPPQAPTSTCCALVKSINPAKYPCFCQYKDNPIFKAIGVDANLIVKLPTKCGVRGGPYHC